MFLAGGPSPGSGVWLGSQIARVNNWSANAGAWSTAWVADVPGISFTPGEGGLWHPTSHMPQSFAVAGDYIFIVYYGGIDPGGVYVVSKKDGSYVGKMLPSFEMWDADCIYCVRAFKRTKGDYLVSFNHHAMASMGLYRWFPPGVEPYAEEPITPAKSPIPHAENAPRAAAQLQIAVSPLSRSAQIDIPWAGTSADIAVYSVDGRQCAAFHGLAVDAVRWEYGPLSGVFTVRATAGGRIANGKIIVP
jgi:hypothetical protein